MSDIIGTELPEAVLNLFDKRITITVVATVDEDGCPHTAPLNFIVARGPKTIRLAVSRQDDTFRNIRRSGSVMIAVMDEGDTAVGIKGAAKVVKEAMDANFAMAMVEVEVQEVKNDTIPAIVVSQGVRTRQRAGSVAFFFKNIFQELLY